MDREELARRLRNTCGLTGHFVLRSGAVSDFYFDKYLFEADPRLLQAVAEHSAPLIPKVPRPWPVWSWGGCRCPPRYPF